MVSLCRRIERTYSLVDGDVRGVAWMIDGSGLSVYGLSAMHDGRFVTDGYHCAF